MVTIHSLAGCAGIGTPQRSAIAGVPQAAVYGDEGEVARRFLPSTVAGGRRAAHSRAAAGLGTGGGTFTFSAAAHPENASTPARAVRWSRRTSANYMCTIGQVRVRVMPS